MEGSLSMVDTGKAIEMFIILFDDMLLITRRKKALSKKVKTSQRLLTEYLMQRQNRDRALFERRHLKNLVVENVIFHVLQWSVSLFFTRIHIVKTKCLWQNTSVTCIHRTLSNAFE